MNPEKKIIIDIKSYAVKKNIKMGDICSENGVSAVSLMNWRSEAPDVVKGIYLALSKQPETNVLKIFKGWQDPPFVLAFIRDFMIKHGCKFTDIVVEI